MLAVELTQIVLKSCFGVCDGGAFVNAKDFTRVCRLGRAG